MLQSVVAPEELMADIEADIDELPSGIEAEAEAETLALTSGVLAEALTLGVLTLAETLAETLALTEALVSWAEAGKVKAQAALTSSAAADSFDMTGFLSGYYCPRAVKPRSTPAVAPPAKHKFGPRWEPMPPI